MSIFDNYLEKKFEPMKRQLKKDFKKELKKKTYEIEQQQQKIIDTEVEDPKWQTLTIGGIGLQEKSSTLLEEYMGWVYANISAIAEAVSEIKIQLFRMKANDEVEEVKEHPVLELLHRPNQYMTKREFIQLLTIYRLLTGESPIRIKNPKSPVELWPLDPLKLTPIIGKTADSFELIMKYEMTDDFNGEYKKVDLKPEEIIFIKNMNPRNKWRGYGVVEAAQNSIDTLQYSELYNLNFFKNSAVPFTVLYTDQKLNEQVRDRLRNSWNSSYKGVNNAFKTAILEAGLKVEKLQSSSKDMDFIEQQRFLRDKLMAMFKTTKVALGITEDVNRANAEASEYVFSKNSIRPKMAQFVESLNEYLLPIFDPKGELFLDFEDPVPLDRLALINEYSAAINKWMTPNEIRQLEGYPDLEGGDEIWQPLNLTTMSNPTPNTPEIQTTPKPTDEQPSANDATASPSPSLAPDEQQQEQPKMYRVLRVRKKKKVRDFSEQIASLKNRNIRLKLVKEELKKEIRKVLKSKIKTRKVEKMGPKYKDMSTKEDTDKYIKSIISNSDRLEKKMNDAMQWKYYQPQMQEIMRKLNRGTKLILRTSIKKIQKAVGDEFMFNETEYVNTGIDILTPLMKQILLEQGYEAILTVDPNMSYSLLDAARKYLNQKPTKIAKSITQTAYERVRNSLAEGIQNGESIPELKVRVLEEYKPQLKNEYGENYTIAGITTTGFIVPKGIVPQFSM